MDWRHWPYAKSKGVKCVINPDAHSTGELELVRYGVNVARRAWLEKGDVFIFYQKGDWTSQRAKDMDAVLARGGGLVYLHFAVYGQKDAPGFAQRIGLAWQDGRSKYRHGTVDLDFGDSRHPIGRTFGKVRFVDETYWRLAGVPKRLTVVASGMEEDQNWPLFWTLEPSKGRVFVSIPGHYAWTFDDPLFRILLLRGIAWAAREPVDRFNGVVVLPQMPEEGMEQFPVQIGSRAKRCHR